MLIFLWLLVFHEAQGLHLYAAAEETYLVSQSPNLKKIYECKDKCFSLNETFSYPMKVLIFIHTVYQNSLDQTKNKANVFSGPLSFGYKHQWGSRWLGHVEWLVKQKNNQNIGRVRWME